MVVVLLIALTRHVALRAARPRPGQTSGPARLVAKVGGWWRTWVASGGAADRIVAWVSRRHPNRGSRARA